MTELPFTREAYDTWASKPLQYYATPAETAQTAGPTAVDVLG